MQGAAQVNSVRRLWPRRSQSETEEPSRAISSSRSSSSSRIVNIISSIVPITPAQSQLVERLISYYTIIYYNILKYNITYYNITINVCVYIYIYIYMNSKWAQHEVCRIFLGRGTGANVKPVCRASSNSKWAQHEVCRTFLGRGTGANVAARELRDLQHSSRTLGIIIIIIIIIVIIIIIIVIIIIIKEIVIVIVMLTILILSNTNRSEGPSEHCGTWPPRRESYSPPRAGRACI